ncbi:F-box/kelch-repeat protein At3g23880-like isoform X3 [Quercus robur]|uniref:F-box/kelch-repeat protein At3g23880-like isoform X3 n=1 Tax=Quercus robur TaxID=38942 RepID=UPI00216213A6|nr:F-box/kelch-repeat protein At3g23880-like isoform X3 [Quercus robur]
MLDLEYLPYDVLPDILHGLPVKSLIRFRCVSKSWNSLITSPAFINSNLTRSPSDSNKLIVRYLDVICQVERYKLIYEDNDNDDSSSSEQIQDLEFPLRCSSRDYFQLVGSANGLFCLHEGNRVILWNPCIRKFITLPNPSFIDVFHCYLAIGFDLRTDDYKVVRIAYQSVNVRCEGAKPPLVEVYSVSEGSWRVTNGGDSYPPRITISNWHPQAAYLNGAVYFAANDWGDAQSLIVLSFDLGDEVFRLISLPNGKFGLDADIGTSVFNGLLSLICYGYQHLSIVKSCSVWVMKEDGVVDSWTKQFTIELNMLRWKVLGFLKNDHVLVQKIKSHGSKLLSYDPESQQVKNLGFYRSTYYSYADNYARNLTLLDKPNDVVSKRKVSKKRKCSQLDATSAFAGAGLLFS